MVEERDDLRKQDSALPRLSTMNDDISKATSDHKRRHWREFVESIDHTIGAISIGCSENQATSVQTVELHRMMLDTCSLATNT